MEKFKKIVVVDETKMNTSALEELKNYADEVEVYHDEPTEDEVKNRVEEAEAIIVSWRTEISEEIIDNSKNLKYIGLACSLFNDESANVAVNYAKQKNIKVTGIFDYGDTGVIEFVISEVIQLLHGFGKHQWKEQPVELSGRKFGIVGLGTTGQLLAKALEALNVEVFYFSRTRKKELEHEKLQYLELKNLLDTCEIISIHLPKNTEILKEKEFKQFGDHKLLINTSLGFPFEEKSFKNWLELSNNYAIFDGDATNSLPSTVKKRSNVIISEKSAGWSQETQERLSLKVLENLKDFLNH
ncbi:NAD(P)-dependent oxidoreductase [Mesonia mobilis]|uniref:2-hydroxyacid dehydrogenase n=1 Tax=Mesonia mobilis TaxID=369791 RepID=A0ABQ3BM81_9FLAO|nr:NAD(P)-dependent oxidoreductase [Mesonia mobilis]MBQ0738283.1 dihydrofolate reductase [Aquimarina celericrescens]GGZ51050.1 2-hydroxyacid dehydrogenase [Mesonia mobilis]